SFDLKVVAEKSTTKETVNNDGQNFVAPANGNDAQTSTVGPAITKTSTTLATPPVDSTKTEPAAPPDASTQHHPFGFDEWKYVPSLTLAIKSQPAQFNSPADTRPSQR